MRTITAARLSYCGLRAMVGDVTLIVSELLTNAILHSGTEQVRLVVNGDGDSLWISVSDGVPGSVELEHKDLDAESGRGLLLVEALVNENDGAWGTSDHGATTWCRLTIPAGEHP